MLLPLCGACFATAVAPRDERAAAVACCSGCRVSAAGSSRPLVGSRKVARRRSLALCVSARGKDDAPLELRLADMLYYGRRGMRAVLCSKWFL